MIELTLDGIAHGGEAIARHGGKVVFVPYAIPANGVRRDHRRTGALGASAAFTGSNAQLRPR